MTIEAKTVRPPATGSARATWRERYGDQRLTVDVDPNRNRADTEFRVDLERRWGPQIGDTRTQDFRMSRAGAIALRDALTAAIEWEAGE